MTDPSATGARTVRRTIAGAVLGGAISAFCGCPVSAGIGLAVELASASGFLNRPLLVGVWGGFTLFGIIIGALFGYLARDLHWEDLR